ncbi:MAG: hypothetical protein A2494_00055 [Candidatus Lloydbacteria bacterium RIFOXYC12_FULL_46_25]|uniref:Excinuclease ABC subunit C n=1 Tax=Candidatus Lloydbacteria bacterium RIFOXYC12_FULL_46_25 TaxID=1798670 RepID=A0A1G2DUY1_9BACT|nr:MAG: hypothetical protein A2494_00055 [Candidatus Lloydbacteria bacterium RIFOXYC12_FULL_46_25]
MTIDDLKKTKLPDAPGVYLFRDSTKKILYIGKATSLRDRVRSYFSNDLIKTRGKHILDMVTLATHVSYEKTDSVLEAVILEASLIKAHQPYYNTKEKDNKSFNYVVITKEEFPKVMTLRERTMLLGAKDIPASSEYIAVYGPFPGGSNLQESLKIIRRIFPFRDTCVPNSVKPCFNRQIGLCPGVCTGEISVREYAERIKEIQLFFKGKKSMLLKKLERSMHANAKVLEFERADEYKRMIFALQHIKDVSLIKEEVREASRRSSRMSEKAFRIEAYDVAHISGMHTVGVMTVLEDGYPKKSEYRKFKIRTKVDISDDVAHLEEVLRRRFAHANWRFPDLIVIDGGVAQRRVALKVLKDIGLTCYVVSVVKDARHKPKAILGDKELASSYRPSILMANAEAHRFAVEYHRLLRDRLPR